MWLRRFRPSRKAQCQDSVRNPFGARASAEAVPRVEELMAQELNHNQSASKET